MSGPMHVVDHGSQWTLFKWGDELLLEISCSHSVLGYSVLIRLRPEEEEAFALEGSAYLDRLAREAQYSGPGTGLQRRDLYRLEYRITEAFEAWRRQKGVMDESPG